MAIPEHQPLLWAWAGVAGLLMVASAVAELFQHFRPSPETLKNSRRIRTWWLICLSVFLAMSCGVVGLGVFFCAVSVIAMKEFAALRFHGQDSRLACGVMAAAAVPLYAFLVWRPGWVPFWAVLAVGLFAVTLGVFAATRSIRDSFLSGLAFLFSAAGLSHVILLAKLPAHADTSRYAGPGTLFFLLLMTSLNDVAQYLWGKGLGRRKVVPRISPNKTLAGLIGGTLTTAALSAGIAGVFTWMRWPVSAGAGLLIGMGGFLGDITVSAYKRSVGVKDSGHLLPGHGGMLDRVDSLCVTAPLLYWFVTWI
jgi:phosphatidate cytidylyltransferase